MIQFLSPPVQTFLGVPLELDPKRVTTAFGFLGVPFGPAYAEDDLVEGLDAPECVRGAYANYPWTNWDGYNFEWKKSLFSDGVPTLTDLGNVVGDLRRIDSVKEIVGTTVSTLLSQNVIPLVQGGLDSVPPLVLAAYDSHEDINVLHIDSHIDFTDHVNGVTDGYSSPIRRIREMPWVHEIVQVGMRGSGRPDIGVVNEARASGNRIVTARDFLREGVDRFLQSISLDRRWVVLLDCDGLDPSVAPGVVAKEPGGLSYYDAFDILTFLSARNRLAGFVTTEFVPTLDIGGLTAVTVSRLFAAVVAMHGTEASTAPNSRISHTNHNPQENKEKRIHE